MKTKIALAVALGLSSTAMAGPQQLQGQQLQVNNQFEVRSVTQNHRPTERVVTSEVQKDYFIIQLHDLPVASYRGGVGQMAATAAAGAKLQPNSAAAKQYRSYVKSQQQSLLSTMKKQLPSVKLDRTFDTVFNGISVHAPGVSLAQLKAMPGVKAVYPEQLYYTQMDQSLDLIKAGEAWAKLSDRDNAGKGIRVAVIDSGIRPENAMFTDEGFDAPASLPGDDYCGNVDSSFCNNKLIVARWSAPTFPVAEQEYMSPLGFDGHGTHVAGTAVGNTTDIEFQGQDVTISGVAPGAYLMSYKALFATLADPTRASGSNAMLLEALEHAVNDGADVINNSWGGGAGMDPALSPYQQAFEAAEAAGVIVVSAAGNSGSGPQTIGCPACIEAGIAVANTTHGRFFANEVAVGAETGLLSIQGGGSTQLSADVSGTVKSALSVDAENVEGCAAFADGSFTGNIALISRGGCTFQDKVDHASAAGASAVIVYNNRAGQPITMALDATTVPAVMISQSAGDAALAQLVDGTADGTIGGDTSRIVSAEFADNTASSSSRGPNGNPNILKPDIAAPGSSILSAMSPEEIGRDGEEFALLTGTSMASPHIAGAAALMRELHPDWSAVEIKTALTSTAITEGLTKEDAETPADHFDIGAGRVDLNAATDAVLTFDKASFANASCVTSCSFSGMVTNRGDSEASWDLSLMLEGVDATVTPAMVTLGAGESANFDIAIDSTFADKDAWLFGKLMFAGDSDAHLPIAIYPEASSNASLLNFSSDGQAMYGEPAGVTAGFTNAGFDGNVMLRMTVPAEVQMVDGTGMITTTGANTNGETVDEANNSITWVGSLDAAELTAATGAGFGFAGFASEENQIACSDGCDEVAFTYNLPPFEYNGTVYSAVTISDNGILIPGADQNTSGTWSNQELPSDTAPNNVIAPFWSDFDLNDGTAGDTGSGTLHIYGAGSYIVVEWNNVAVYDDDSGARYTFQAFLGYGDAIGDNWFNYTSLDALPANLTVGVEDIAGVLGRSVYYNGAGDAPVSDSIVQISTIPGGNVTFDVDLVASVVDVAADDSLDATEETAINLDVVSNDTAVVKVPLHLMASHDGDQLESIQLLEVGGEAPSAIVITEAPANGTATVNDDLTIAYTPADDFFGEDSFSYEAQDADGKVIGSASASVTVANVNDAPVATAASGSGSEGSTISIALSATDVDGDDLTWSITPTGDAADLGAEVVDGMLTFTAPQVDADTQFTFNATANDGTVDSNTVEVTATVTDTVATTSSSGSSSSGSLGWFTLLLLPLLGLRRRS